MNQRFFENGIAVGILGATGAVGRSMLSELETRGFPVRELRCFASSEGRTLPFLGKAIPVEAPSLSRFAGLDLLLSSAPSGITREWVPQVAAQGTIVVDNSSAFRLDADVPLVVPEVNGDRLRNLQRGIIANPNCCAIQLVVALKPLQDAAGLRRVIVATYQSSSGRGARGLAQLDAEIAADAAGLELAAPTAHSGVLAGNVLSNDWPFDDEGFSEEERKIENETRKILEHPSLGMSVTTVRVPVRSGHGEAVWVELDKALSVAEAAECFRAMPGVVYVDAADRAGTPSPRVVAGRSEVFVSRLRVDSSVANGLSFWVVADNVKKGAATNAVQIAEKIFT